MSTASRGKKWERDLCSELEEYPLTAERVPRSVADALPGPIDDVVCVPGEMETADHDHRAITNHLQDLTDDTEAFLEYVQRVTCIEVKYTSSGGYGVQTLLSTHLETIGLGTREALWWSAADVYTGGLAAFAEWVLHGETSYWELDDSPPSSAVGLLDEADAAAVRAEREPWALIWE